MQGNVGKCADCKFWIQAETHSVCGHKEANMTEDGNGQYIYPPMGTQCDINKFEQRELPFREEMAKSALEHGWIKVSDGEIPRYRKA